MIRTRRNFAMGWRGATLAGWFCALLGLAVAAQAQVDGLVKERWYEARTAHFNIYSCGPTQEVSKLGARLEQFHDAYGLLAGAQAVVSPPITMLAFPSQEAMQPFLPLYNGKPANLIGLFKRSSDEDIIILGLTGTNSPSLDTIFHEYSHLLFRHNGDVWPMWLAEGMAEMYSTFECTGRGVRIGKPIRHHLRLLEQSELMPLSELLSVTHDSPQYNEEEHQGVFYAESWLLTHFLMNGDNLAYRRGFAKYTGLLRQGKSSGQALTEALGARLPAIEAELRRYLARGQFEPVSYVVSVDLSAPRAMATRPIGQGEVCFRLGNELMRLDRLDAAEPYFAEAKKLAPNSPLSYEGLGLLAGEHEQHAEAARLLKESIQRGSTSFRAHYCYAQERLNLTADSQQRFKRVDAELASELRSELLRSIGLMPSFGPAHELLGFFELVQGEDYTAAEQHLRRAIQLEPERQSYRIYLAETQLRLEDTAGARSTLQPLTLPFVEKELRDRAKQVLSEIDRKAARQP